MKETGHKKRKEHKRNAMHILPCRSHFVFFVLFVAKILLPGRRAGRIGRPRCPVMKYDVSEVSH